MNSTRQKRLFLLILTLAGMCPAIYCADHEEPAVFESNINLPLQGEQGEEIVYADMPINRYEILLSTATSVPIYFAASFFILSRLMPHLDLFLTNHRSRSWLFSAALAASIPSAILTGYLFRKIQTKSFLAILRCRNLLNQARTQHNRAVNSDVNYEGMIVTDEQGNRTLLTRHDNEVGNYPFDRWRQDRQVAMSGLVNKILLGPGNLARIRAINEKLDALDDQLLPIRNIKGGRR